jgi:hypothetical protein
MTRAQFLELINTLGTGDKNTALEVRNIFNAFADAAVLTGDIKEVDCDNTYLALNFDNTGLGKNERVGWAICNGLNGTRDRNGRTSIAYGSDYTTIGAPGGEKEHTLTIPEMPAHKIKIKGSSSTSGGTGQNVVNNANNNTGDVESYSIGGDEPHNNMQPYIVSLFIQKL